jgi:RHS repeat-associated protein
MSTFNPSGYFRRSRVATIALVLCLLSSSTPAAPQTIGDFAAAWLALGQQTPLDHWGSWLQASGTKRGANQGMPAAPVTAPGVRPRAPESISEREVRVARLEIHPGGNITMHLNDPLILVAVPLDANDSPIHGLTSHWVSRDTSVVAVAPDGQAKARALGTAHLTAQAGNKQASVDVTVVPRPDDANVSAVNRTLTGALNRGARAMNTRQRGKSVGASGARAQHFHHSAPASPPLTWDYEENRSLLWATNNLGRSPGAGGTSTPGSAAQTTEKPGSANFSFSVPVAELPGRGLDVDLSLYYNSRIWNKSTTSSSSTRMTYNVNGSAPAPGFNLGYGMIKIVRVDEYEYEYILSGPDGSRHEFVWHTDSYRPTDGSFISLSFDSGSNPIATFPDGSQILYGCNGTYPSKITDRNGNYILISYVSNNGPKIDTIQDSLGRYITFYYASNGDLVTVTAPGLTGQSDRQTIRFYYADITVNQSNLFASGILKSAPTTAHVISYIYLPNATESGDAHLGWRYDYSAYGMIYQITQFRGMTVSSTSTSSTGSVSTEGSTAALTTYNYPTTASSLTNVPTYTQRTDDWAGRTTGMGGNPSTAPYYTFSVNESTGVSSVTAPEGTVTETTVNVSPGWAPSDGLPTLTTVKVGTTLLASSTPSWATDSDGYNPRLSQVKIKNDAGQTKATVFTYDDSNSIYNNVSVVSERDFTTDDSVSSTELRRTESTYLNDSSYWSRGLIHLPTSVKVYNPGVSTAVSQVDYLYDESSYLSTSSLSGIVMYTSPGTTVRGDVTTVNTYPDTSNTDTYVSHHTSYDTAGNTVSADVDCCQQKAFTYSSSYYYAYPTSVVRGGSGTTLTSSASYDFNTGLVATTTDENSQTASNTYNGDSLRLSETDSPDGGVTSYTYSDALAADANGNYHFYVETSTKLDTPGGTARYVNSFRYLDGRGAVARTFDGYTSGDGYATKDIEYDIKGRAYRASNPYYSSGYSASINPDGFWTTNTFDNLGRVTQVTMPAGDNSTSATTHVDTSFDGVYTTVTDQAGKVRRQKVDPLGRLIRLDEPTSSGLGSTTSSNQATSYDYDVLNNLVHINQGSQDRYFKYDSLSRLIRERQVEQDTNSSYNLSDSLTGNSSWTRKIEYDSSGLVTDAYDARGVHAQFSYDGLNRVTQISYSDSTPTAHYYYDSQTLPTGAPSTSSPDSYSRGYSAGRLVAMSYGSGATGNYFGYDNMGQVNMQFQLTGSTPTKYKLTYSYNYLGELTGETYPSGRAMVYGYDEGGRLSSVSDGTTTFANTFTYAPHGGLSSETWGNTSVHAMSYNRRLQPSQAKLSLGSTVLQQYDYGYGEFNTSTGAVDTSKNNGQIGKTDGTIGATAQWNQGLSYDELGRLSNIAEHQGNTMTTSTYSQGYTFDRYGNRFQSANSTLALPAVSSSDINASTNRFITSGSTPTTYDAAGNITQDTKFRGLTYAYDANGRQTSASNGTWTETQTYDAAGQRVQTSVSSTTRTMVYDIFGQDVADYSGSTGGTLEKENIYRGAQLLATYEAGSNALKYVLIDIQGSTRAVMNNSGSSSSVIARHDYLPFGEEISAGVGLRTSGQGFGATDTNRQQYGLTERDDATGLDHTWFRKYENLSGRFTGPDPYTGSISTADPQSFNRYAYVFNDPGNKADPTGLMTNDEWFAKMGFNAAMGDINPFTYGLAYFKGHTNGHIHMSAEMEEAESAYARRVFITFTIYNLVHSKPKGATTQNEIDAYQAAMKDLTDRIVNRPECAAFFGGVEQALGALAHTQFSVENLGLPTQDSSGQIHLPPDAKTEGTKVTLNKYGAFFGNNPPFFGLQGAAASALMLGHELGHRTGSYGIYDVDWQQWINRRNTQAVFNACFN